MPGLTVIDSFAIFGEKQGNDMKTERKKVFETNSSSCHSITFCENAANGMVGLKIYVNGSGEYGWQEETLCNSNDKLDYAVVAFMELMYKDLDRNTKFIDISNEIHKLKSEMKTRVEKAIDGVTECFKNHGVELIFDPDLGKIEVHSAIGDSYAYCYVKPKCSGYIDHASAPREGGDSAVLAEWFENDPEKLYNFVFNDSYITLDNDNHD